MFVRFLQTRTVKAIDGKTFFAGEVYELSEESARRWLRRGVAEIYAKPSASSLPPTTHDVAGPSVLPASQTEESEDGQPKPVKRSVGRPRSGSK